MSITQPGSTGAHILSALEAYQLKPDGDHQWRCNSPLRPGSDSHSFRIKIQPDGEHGAWHDHVSGEGGSLYELAARLNIALPERTSVPDTKRAYQGLEDYAEAHGVEASVLTAARWQFVRISGRPALEFPTRTGTRWRFLDGAKPAYKSEANYQRCWYRLEHAIKIANATEQPLVICNGEISTLVGQHYGVAACCVTAGEKPEIPPDLLNALKMQWQGRILVAFDCLDKGSVDGPQLAVQLQSVGFEAKAVDLRLSKGGDLADFCKLHGSGAAQALGTLPEPTSETEANPLLPYLVHAREVHKLPPLKWLIPNELPESGLTVVYGPSGVGKSFFVLDMALRLAQTLSVLYVASEGESGVPKRVAAWQRHHNQGVGELQFLLNIVSLLDKTERGHFEDIVRRVRPKLIVIDTLAHCMLPGEENSTRDMGLFVRAAKNIQRKHGCAVLLVHHVGKYSEIERGSIALRAAADTMILLADEDDIIRVECTKSKDTLKTLPRYMRLLPVPLDNDDSSATVIAAEKVVQTQDDPLTPRQDKVLRVFAMEIFREAGASLSDIEDSTGISRGQAHRVVSKLFSLGFLTRRSPSYCITEAGYTRLGLPVPKQAKPTDSPDSPLTHLTRLKSESARTDPGTMKNSQKGASHPSHPHGVY